MRKNSAEQCICKNWVCFKCNKKGHIANHCLSKRTVGRKSNVHLKTVNEMVEAASIPSISKDECMEIKGVSTNNSECVKLIVGERT